MESSGDPLSLVHFVEISHQFLISLLQNLDQTDIDTLLKAEPNMSKYVVNLQQNRFPLIKYLNVLESTKNPICVGKLYKNVRVSDNFAATHPVSQAILQNSEHLSRITFGVLDVDNFVGTLAEELLNRNLSLDSVTIERLSFNPFRVAPPPFQIISTRTFKTRVLRINALAPMVRNRHFVTQCNAIASFLTSFRRIEQFPIPDRLLLWPNPVMLLLENIGNVECFSLQNWTIDMNSLLAVVHHAELHRRRLMFVPFKVIEFIAEGDLKRLFGPTIQTMVRVVLRIGVPLERKIRILIQNANLLEVCITNERIIMDVSSLESNRRSVVLTSPDKKFPLNGLRRFTSVYVTIRLIFGEFGLIDVLDLQNCRLPSRDKIGTFKTFYCERVGSLVT